MGVLPVSLSAPVTKYAKKAAIGGVLLASSILMPGCQSPKTNNSIASNHQTEMVDTITEQAVKSDTVVEVKPEPLDLTKPNIPIIAGREEIFAYTYRYWAEYAVFKDFNGKDMAVKLTDPYWGYHSQYQFALYRAIPKFSTEESPNITDIDGFIQEVVDQGLLKVPVWKKRKGERRRRQVVNRFLDMINRYTAPNSDGGKDITVREYTSMMKEYPYI